MKHALVDALSVKINCKFIYPLVGAQFVGINYPVLRMVMKAVVITSIYLN